MNAWLQADVGIAFARFVPSQWRRDVEPPDLGLVERSRSTQVAGSSPAVAPPPPPPAVQRDEAEAGAHFMRNLSELLDDIEGAFKALTFKSLPDSMIEADLRAGLTTMGPYCPVSGIPDYTFTQHRLMTRSRRSLSSLIFVAMCAGEIRARGDDAKIAPHFFYARRLARLPWYAVAQRGTVYQCGMAFEVEPEKFLWLSGFVTIDDDGYVHLVKQFQHELIHAPGGHRYTRVRCAVPRYIAKDKDWDFEAIVASYISFWQEKDVMWQVSVRRHGQRATFCVDTNDAKSYFKDRGRTALTSAGKRRPIVHVVHEHERILRSGATTTVREHIRGLRLFDWRGYDCAVIAPTFHRAANEFKAGGEEMDEPIAGSLDAAELGRRLAEAEDVQ